MSPSLSEVLLAGSLPLQFGIVAALIEGYRRREGAVVVNAATALSIAVVVTWFGSALAAERIAGAWALLSLWVSVAGFLHCLGMLGWYETVGWWDHLTHTASATLVAALLYAGLAATGSFPALAVVTVGSTLLVGVAWELVELLARRLGERFGNEPVLVYYGRRDTALDLAFDAVGAVLVVLFDLRVFVPLVERAPEVVDALFPAGV